ncbi:Hexokinase [Aspergillus sp. HF37]|nr:Hexokinase [Aspergillus sp. HF37]
MAQSLGEHAEPPLQAEQVACEFDIRPDQVCRVTRHFVQKMKNGLANRCAWQLPTYVRTVPTGTETGRFLAVDLGGSNCRICLVDLHGDSTFTVVQSKHTVPANAMVNPSYRPVFAFIAERIADFLEAHRGPGRSLLSDAGRHEGQCSYQLGFTFSFVCEQTSLARGTLIRWDKGWDIPDAVGRDPCALLQEAIDNLGLPVQVSALANDSVGTLLTRSYSSGQGGSTLGAVIFGTGANAAYVEKLSNVRRMDTKAEDAGDIMVINTEWGCFDEELEVLPTTRYDDELDANSIDPGSQMFEKRVSGMYLGELLRLAILRLLRGNVLHMHVHNGSRLFQPGGIGSSFLSRLAGDDGRDSEHANMIVAETLAADSVTLTDIQSIQILVASIARRAARLAGASLAAIVLQSGQLETAPPSAKLSKIKAEECHPLAGPPIGRLQRFVMCGRLLLRWVLSFFGMGSLITAPSSPSASAPAASSIVDESPEELIDIGADGSLIEFYPTFVADMRAAMREIPEIGPDGERRIRIGLAKDGSGVGAALMAQAAEKVKTRD